MSEDSRHQRQPLSTRLILARRDIARFTARRWHGEEENGGIRQPSKFSLLMLIALTAIGMVAVISILQLMDAAFR